MNLVQNLCSVSRKKYTMLSKLEYEKNKQNKQDHFEGEKSNHLIIVLQVIDKKN